MRKLPTGEKVGIATHNNVPFGVAKPYFNIYTPFSPKTAIFGPILTVRRHFWLKSALTLEVLRVNDP